ncbi:MAG: adenosylmethionine decarboxylase [Firmicutes bacterium]|nr:adenosylmethionine decarboxylase [Bacillota bacterium]
MLTQALGRHILCEAYGCDRKVLNDVRRVEKIMVAAALAAGAEVREVAFHHFSPQGVSGVVVISESHLAIHTWPEFGYAAIDVFTCGESVDPWVACDYLFEKFDAQNVQSSEVQRGMVPMELLRIDDEKVS